MLGAEAGEGGGAKQSRQEVGEADRPQAVDEEGPEDETGVWHTGVCKWFNPSKGWGFINLTEIQVESKESELTDDQPKVCKNESEAATLEKKKDGQKVIDKHGECEVEEGLPSGDIFVHQSTIQKEGFRYVGFQVFTCGWSKSMISCRCTKMKCGHN